MGVSLRTLTYRAHFVNRTLHGHRTIISRFAVVGALIFSGCYDGSLLVWSLKAGECVRRVDKAHNAVVRGVKWADG